MAKRKQQKEPVKRYYTTRGGLYRNGAHIPAGVVFMPLDPEESPGKSWVPYHGALPKRVYRLPGVGAPPAESTRRAMSRTSVPTNPGHIEEAEGQEVEPSTLSEAADIENEEMAERMRAAGADPSEIPRRAHGSRIAKE